MYPTFVTVSGKFVSISEPQKRTERFSGHRDAVDFLWLVCQTHLLALLGYVTFCTILKLEGFEL
jgi:hypothetical protein